MYTLNMYTVHIGALTNVDVCMGEGEGETRGLLGYVILHMSHHKLTVQSTALLWDGVTH